MVQEGRDQDRALSSASIAENEVRCAELDGQRYCLHFGWTHKTENAVVADVASTPVVTGEPTGDLSLPDHVAQHAALSELAQARLEREELEDAPSNAIELPERFAIFADSRIRQQNTTYYCGPASFQSIEWNWDLDMQGQDNWAGDLGTTGAGTAITAMVRETNQHTGWDNSQHAGTYVVLDISSYSFSQWYSLNYRHTYNYRAPVILHPQLLTQYFPYLDDNGSGHFQVGRGYDFNNGPGVNQIGYFEPWNQAKFDPSERFIPRVQWRSAMNSYRANRAHPAKNIGV